MSDNIKVLISLLIDALLLDHVAKWINQSVVWCESNMIMEPIVFIILQLHHSAIQQSTFLCIYNVTLRGWVYGRIYLTKNILLTNSVVVELF